MVQISLSRWLDYIAKRYLCQNLCFSSSRAHRRKRKLVALFCSTFIVPLLFFNSLSLLPSAHSRTERGENFIFQSPVFSANDTLDLRIEETVLQSIDDSSDASETWIIRSFKRLFCANEICINPYIGMKYLDVFKGYIIVLNC